MQPKVQIVEDDPIIARDLQGVLTDRGFEVVGIAHSFDQAIEVFNDHKPDVMLVDIVLKGARNGVDLVETINRSNHRCSFVYLTGSSDDTTKNRAFGTNPAVFLTKPFSEENVVVSLELAIDKSNKQNRSTPSDQNFLFLKSNGRFVKIPMHQISYLEGDGSYTKIFTDSGEKIQTGNLRSFISRLENHFIRIHRSYIVNVARIESVDSQYVYLDGIKLPIGRKYKENIKQIIG